MKKIFDKLYIAVAIVLTATLSLSLLLLPDKNFSEKENRTLAKAPKLTVTSLFTGEYTDKLGSYYADQFPLRDIFVASKAYIELMQGKRENNGVIYCDGDILVPRDESENIRLEENLKIIDDFAKRTEAEVTVVALPRSADVFAEYLPKSYPQEESVKIWNRYNTAVSGLNINTVDAYGILCESNEYYRTDHHYTTSGAYSTYCLLGEKLGFIPKTEDFFTKEKVADDFCGTSMRSSGFYLAERDEITLFRYENDMNYTVTADGKEGALYDFSRLDTTDKYSVFLGGNHARVDVKGEEGKEKLLIIRDSFADSLVPFLAIHYDIALVDFRYYSESVTKLMEQEGISSVLILESISELSTAKNISYLNME